MFKPGDVVTVSEMYYTSHPNDKEFPRGCEVLVKEIDNVDFVVATNRAGVEGWFWEGELIKSSGGKCVGYEVHIKCWVTNENTVTKVPSLCQAMLMLEDAEAQIQQGKRFEVVPVMEYTND